MKNSLLRRFFGPKTSLILHYDHLNAATLAEFEAQVSEVGEFYHFVKLCELVPSQGRIKTGCAAIVFPQGRRSILLQGVPVLAARDIPFTIFVDPSLIGTNRLSLFDELQIYRDHFPGGLSAEEVAKLRQEYFLGSADRASFLSTIKARFGPLPLNDLEPTYFAATWGSLAELDREFCEIGLTLEKHPRVGNQLTEELAFVERQWRGKIVSTYSNFDVSDCSAELSRAGIRASVVAQKGEVTPRVSPYALPCFSLAESDDTSGI